MLTIVGCHSSAREHPVFQSDAEIWAFNACGTALPRCDALFQIHPPDKYGGWGGGFAQRWLRNNTKVPVYMDKVYPEVPMSVRYPFEAALGLLPNVKFKGQTLQFFTSTATWAIALAILLDKKRIHLIGLDMQEEEYLYQHGGFAYWVGVAGGRGIELEIDCADNIFDKPLYPVRK